MPYHRQSPSKYKWLPGWIRRQQQDVVDREYAYQRTLEWKGRPNWGVPKGREL